MDDLNSEAASPLLPALSHGRAAWPPGGRHPCLRLLEVRFLTNGLGSAGDDAGDALRERAIKEDRRARDRGGGASVAAGGRLDPSSNL